MDLEIREFQVAITNFINSSPLLIEVKRLCLKDICGQLDSAATQEIQKQVAERDRAEKEKKDAEEVQERGKPDE